LVVVLMAWVTTLALALPTPKDIEAAVNAGHNAQAEAMLREVIQEKPKSAKAHYELGQVLAREARYAEAQSALKQAQAIDPSLKFAASPEKFTETLDKVSRLVPAAATTATTAAQTPAAASPVAAPATASPQPGGVSMTYVWVGIGVIVALGVMLLRRAHSPAPRYSPATTPATTPGMASAMAPTAPMPAGAPMAPRGFGAQFTPQAAGAAPGVAPGYGPGYGPGYAPPTAGTGSTMTGAVVGGLAGVAAGYALSKALEGDYHSGQTNQANAGNSAGYVPFDTPAQPDLGTFDAGSGDSWDDASSGGDDSW
jgi:hypothetical protein